MGTVVSMHGKSADKVVGGRIHVPAVGPASWFTLHRVLLIVLVSSLGVVQPRSGLALGEKNYVGPCKSELLKWKKRGGYGAAAIAKNGYCGFSWDAFSPEDARSSALAHCRAGKKGKGCVVTSTIGKPSKFVSQRKLCGALKAQESIDACTLLLAKKGGDKIMRAWHFNERGRNYMNMGFTDKAIADFSDSIKTYPRTDAAYVNRARLYVERGMLEEAIADFRKSIKNYNKLNEDYRPEANSRLKELEARLGETRQLTEAKLCYQALDPTLIGWDKSRPYAVREAERRKLTLDSCFSAYVATLDSKWICNMAFDRAASNWSTNPRNRRYVSEVNTRKLSPSDCRRQLGLAP